MNPRSLAINYKHTFIYIYIGNLSIQYGYNQPISHIHRQILEYVLEAEDTTNYITYIRFNPMGLYEIQEKYQV